MMPSSRLARALTAAGIPFETSVLLRDCTTFRIGGCGGSAVPSAYAGAVGAHAGHMENQ